MAFFSHIVRKHFHSHFAGSKICCLHRLLLVLQMGPFWAQLCYFLTFSLAGFLALKLSKPRATGTSDFDMFFTSVSATTVSSMSTVEMEVFSDHQLIVITILMFVGGEVFTSMLGLCFFKSKLSKQYSSSTPRDFNQIELKQYNINIENGGGGALPNDEGEELIKYNSIKMLFYVVMGYLVLVHVFGSSLVSVYMSVVPSAGQVLRNKGIPISIFSVFTTVSTFANCGFVPTNENMVVFNRNSGLLLLLIPQMLLGNTLYGPCLRLLIWVLDKTSGRSEFGYMLRNWGEMDYGHLFSASRSCLIALTALAFVLVQFVVFCSMEWTSGVMAGLGSYHKLVGALFQTANSRHAGESVFDLSMVSPAILVLFTLMMYLPSYTTYSPTRVEDQDQDHSITKQKKKPIAEWAIFSQLSYLVIFTILICIIERENIKEDPLNFSVLNIAFEVISAFGNAGFSSGYSCKRQVRAVKGCKDLSIGLVGRWNWKAKFVLIVVMLFGRLKKFSRSGGQSWILS